MKKIQVEQNTPEWLEARRGLITGSTAKGIIADTYKSDPHKLKTFTMQFWELMAGRIATPDDGTPPDVRGHELEDYNAQLTVSKINADKALAGEELITADYDPGMWVSDDNPSLAVSPDVADDSDKPTWAIECKSLSTARHLSIVVPYLMHKDGWDGSLGAYRIPISDRDWDYIPSDYQYQILQYFIVNESLKVVYFSLYDPRIADPVRQHTYITVNRVEILTNINVQRHREENTLKMIQTMESYFPMGAEE